MRPLIVGQAPGPNTDPARPLSGRCGARLATLAGVTGDGFEALFERINLLDKFPGKAGKGDEFPLDQARAAAGAMIMHGDLARRPVVLLGQNVARAFFLPMATKTLVWLPDVILARLAVAPHPSGVSRWWNEPANVRKARRFWSALAMDALARELEPCPAAPRRRP